MPAIPQTITNLLSTAKLARDTLISDLEELREAITDHIDDLPESAPEALHEAWMDLDGALESILDTVEDLDLDDDGLGLSEIARATLATGEPLRETSLGRPR